MTSAARTSTTTSVRRRLPTHRPLTHPGQHAARRIHEALGYHADRRRGAHARPVSADEHLGKGRRGVTVDTALRLAALTGMEAGFWMGLQADYDLWHALKDVDLSKITPLKSPREEMTGRRVE